MRLVQCYNGAAELISLQLNMSDVQFNFINVKSMKFLQMLMRFLTILSEECSIIFLMKMKRNRNTNLNFFRVNYSNAFRAIFPWLNVHHPKHYTRNMDRLKEVTKARKSIFLLLKHWFQPYSCSRTSARTSYTGWNMGVWPVCVCVRLYLPFAPVSLCTKEGKAIWP